jgi:hypothetical protein
MKNPLLNKTFLSPFVAVAFVVIAATGVLLFFHVKNGPIMALHEWFGWVFVVAGVIHLLLNLSPLLAYLKRPAALVSVGVALALVALLWIGGAQHEGEHHRRGHGPGPDSGQSPAAPSTLAAMP